MFSQRDPDESTVAKPGKACTRSTHGAHDPIDNGTHVTECRACGMRLRYLGLQWREAPVAGETYSPPAFKKLTLAPKPVKETAAVPTMEKLTTKMNISDRVDKILKYCNSDPKKVSQDALDSLVKFLLLEDTRKSSKKKKGA